MKRLNRGCYIVVLVSLCALPFYANLLQAENNAPAEKNNAGSGLAKAQYDGYNIIMISINNIGTEHMGLYGYGRNTTPRLSKWSREAFIFEDVFTPASWTLPAATSCLTSLQPYSHKIIDRYNGNILSKDIQTLPEILRGNNYATAAFTGGLDYMAVFGHMRGFTDIDNNPPFTGFDVSLAQAKKWLSSNQNNKFFLFIHGYDAHAPFEPPAKFKGRFSNPRGRNISVDPRLCLRGYKDSDKGYVAAHYVKQDNTFLYKGPANKAAQERKKILAIVGKKEIKLKQEDIDYLRDLYDEEILSVDYMVGRFLNSLDKKLLKKTIIIIFSEHGEMFAKHGRFGRAGTVRGTLYDDVVHVPLMIKMPGIKGKRINGLVQLLDIMPFLLDITGIPAGAQIQGKSLLPLMNETSAVNDYAFAGAQYNTKRPQPNPYFNFESVNESIRDVKWKLIHEIVYYNDVKEKATENKTADGRRESFELYDLLDDPNEFNNLAGKYPEIVKELAEKLFAWAKMTREFVPAVPSTKEFSTELLEEAKENGYW